MMSQLSYKHLLLNYGVCVCGDESKYMHMCIRCSSYLYLWLLKTNILNCVEVPRQTTICGQTNANGESIKRIKQRGSKAV